MVWKSIAIVVNWPPRVIRLIFDESLIGRVGAARSPQNLCTALLRRRGELEQIEFLLGHVSIQTNDTSVANSGFKEASMTESG
jgi:hypothetical protein